MVKIMPRLHAFVYGQVQGVFFRAFVENAARKLKLVGFVRNCDDGSVEVVADGSKIVLGGLLEALRKGPTTAKVDHVDVKWEKESGEFSGFEMR
jgi:acylphosphatase